VARVAMAKIELTVVTSHWSCVVGESMDDDGCGDADEIGNDDDSDDADYGDDDEDDDDTEAADFCFCLLIVDGVASSRRCSMSCRCCCCVAQIWICSFALCLVSSLC